MSDPVIYRVFKLPASLLTAMREKRDQVETTNVRFLAEAVDSHLPNLVEELQRLGFGVHGGDQKVARLPFTDEAVTLGQLKEAAETVGLPATPRTVRGCDPAATGAAKTTSRAEAPVGRAPCNWFEASQATSKK
jgi:hypothetical protein